MVLVCQWMLIFDWSCVFPSLRSKVGPDCYSKYVVRCAIRGNVTLRSIYSVIYSVTDHVISNDLVNAILYNYN